MMKNRICMIMALIFLSQAALLPISASEAEAETRVTITFAAGGAACGIFLLLRFTFTESLIQEHRNEAAALFNRGPEGWEVAFPSISTTRSEHFKMISGEQSPDTVQLELLRFRF